MPRSLAALKATKGVIEPLRGKELKDTLINEEVPFLVTAVQMGEFDNGPGWQVTVKYERDLHAVNSIIIGMNPNRDDDMQLMAEEATEEDPFGPFILTRNGRRGYLRLEEVNGATAE